MLKSVLKSVLKRIHFTSNKTDRNVLFTWSSAPRRQKKKRHSTARKVRSCLNKRSRDGCWLFSQSNSGGNETIYKHSKQSVSTASVPCFSTFIFFSFYPCCSFPKSVGHQYAHVSIRVRQGVWPYTNQTVGLLCDLWLINDHSPAPGSNEDTAVRFKLETKTEPVVVKHVLNWSRKNLKKKGYYIHIFIFMISTHLSKYALVYILYIYINKHSIYLHKEHSSSVFITGSMWI